MEKIWAIWAGGGSLEVEEGQRTDDTLSFYATRCHYAEFFRARGLAKFGFLFCCNRDFALVEGFGHGLALTRTQTVMQGASHCDFHYNLRKPEDPPLRNASPPTVE